MSNVTLIGKDNEKYFAPYLSGFKEEDNTLRLGLIKDKKAVAAMVLEADEDFFLLRHIFVDENERRKGYAGELLKDFLDRADDGRFSGVAAYYSPDEAVDALLFGEGFLVVPGNELCVIDSNALLSSKNIRSLRESTESLRQIRPLSTLTVAEKASLEDLLKREDVSPDVLKTLDYDPDISAAIFDNSGAKATVLVEKDNDFLMLSFLCSDSASGTKNLRMLLTHLTKIIMKDVSISRISFYAQNKSMYKFAKKLVGDESLIKKQRLTTNASLVFPSAFEEMAEDGPIMTPLEAPGDSSEVPSEE